MADTSHDEIKLFDRCEFIEAMNIHQTKVLFRSRVIAIASGIFFLAWLMGYAFLPVKVGVVIFFCGFVPLVIGFAWILCKWEDGQQILCPHCASMLLQKFDWKHGKVSLWSMERKTLLALGKCSYCRKDIFTEPATTRQLLTLNMLHGGKTIKPWLGYLGLLLIPCIFISVIAGGLLLSGDTPRPNFTALCFAALAGFYLLLALKSCCRLFDWKPSPAIPCPVCAGDLSRDNLRAIAVETGGCGYCGARIVADFTDNTEPRCSEEERRQQLAKRRKNGLLTMFFGISMLVVAIVVICGGGLLVSHVRAHGEDSEAAVLAVSESKNSFSFDYRFQSGSHPVTAKAFWGRGKIQKGDKLPIQYWSSYPTAHIVDGRLADIISLCFAFSIMVVILGGLYLALGLWVFRGNDIEGGNGRFIRLRPGEILSDHFPDEEECAKLRQTTINMSLREANRLSSILKYGWLFLLLLSVGGIFAGWKLLAFSRLMRQDDVKIGNVLFYGGIGAFIFAGAMLIYAVIEIRKLYKSSQDTGKGGRE